MLNHLQAIKVPTLISEPYNLANANLSNNIKSFQSPQSLKSHGIHAPSKTGDNPGSIPEVNKKYVYPWQLVMIVLDSEHTASIGFLNGKEK